MYTTKCSLLKVAILLMICTGCNSSITLHFCAVDRKPLSGVKVIYTSYNNNLLESPENEQIELPLTSQDGCVVAQGLKADRTHKFLFSKAGYTSVLVMYQPHSKIVGIDLGSDFHAKRSVRVQDGSFISIDIKREEAK